MDSFGVLEPPRVHAHDALMHDGRARLSMRLGHRRRHARADRPDDLEILEAAPAAARAPLEVRQHGVDDAAMKADQQHHAVGDLACELDGLGPRRCHQERHRSARGIREPAGCAVEVDGLAGE